MSNIQVLELSAQLKDIAKDLSFLGHPRYPLKELTHIFPQHTAFINELEDVSVPFGVNVKSKRLAMDQFLINLEKADIPQSIKVVFTHRLEDYHTLLSMMENFNNVFFYDYCTRLYGTSHHLAHDNNFQLFLEKIPEFCVPTMGEKTLKATRP